MGLFSWLTDDILGLGGGEDAAAEQYEKAYDLFDQMEVPNWESILDRMGEYTYGGDFTPEMAKAIAQDPTELSNVSVDPRLKGAQMNALERLSSLAEEGGLSATDRARLADIEADQGRAARGAREALEQGAQARGTAGSGLSLVNQMIANQEAANRASRAGQDTAARAEMRALEALMKSGEMGGQIREQDYREAANRATAQDAINRFNTMNRQGASDYNTQAKNAAGLSNLRERQRITNQNTGYRNDAIRDLIQRQYENELARRRGMSGQLGNVADTRSRKGKAQDTFTGGAIGTAASFFGG
jgi:hypothetical protein